MQRLFLYNNDSTPTRMGQQPLDQAWARPYDLYMLLFVSRTYLLLRIVISTPYQAKLSEIYANIHV